MGRTMRQGQLFDGDQKKTRPVKKCKACGRKTVFYIPGEDIHQCSHCGWIKRR